MDLVVKITQALGILNQQNYMLSVACLFHLVFVRTDTDGLSEREDDGCAWDGAPGYSLGVIMRPRPVPLV